MWYTSFVALAVIASAHMQWSRSSEECDEEPQSPERATVPAGEDAQPSLLQLRARKVDDGADLGLLIILRTRYENIDTRLKHSRDTWMKEVLPQDRVITVVSDPGLKKSAAAPKLEGVPITAINCPDSHNVGLNCEMGEVFRQVLPLAAEQYDGFFVVDDDAYLDVPNLRKAFTKLNRQISDGKVAFGVWGCVEKPWYGFCGGAGYGVTKAGARALMNLTATSDRVDAANSTKSELKLEAHKGTASSADEFVTQYLEESLRLFKGNARHHAWEDVAFGATVKNLGLKIEKLDGLYGWALKPDDYEKAVRSCNPLPINFHYVTTELKHKLHTDLKAHGCVNEAAQSPELALRERAWYVSTRRAALQEDLRLRDSSDVLESPAVF
jgi:hypothetical protein